MRTLKLIAFDMDGTLLDSRKRISERTIQAARRAAEAGKILVFNSGRSLMEMRDFFGILPEFRYSLCCSGAFIHEITTGRNIVCGSIGKDSLEILMQEILPMEETLPQFATVDGSYVARTDLDRLEQFGMGAYRRSFETVMTHVENIRTCFHTLEQPVLKLNVYHTEPAARERTLARILERGLPVVCARSETTSVEISGAGVDKGTGLTRLCDMLGIDPSEAIAVGDGDNDLAVLQTAGLAVVMANGTPAALREADAVVADCDHDGCAEAIEKYLLNERQGSANRRRLAEQISARNGKDGDRTF